MFITHCTVQIITAHRGELLYIPQKSLFQFKNNYLRVLYHKQQSFLYEKTPSFFTPSHIGQHLVCNLHQSLQSRLLSRVSGIIYSKEASLWIWALNNAIFLDSQLLGTTQYNRQVKICQTELFEIGFVYIQIHLAVCSCVVQVSILGLLAKVCWIQNYSTKKYEEKQQLVA